MDMYNYIKVKLVKLFHFEHCLLISWTSKFTNPYNAMGYLNTQIISIHSSGRERRHRLADNAPANYEM